MYRKNINISLGPQFNDGKKTVLLFFVIGLFIIDIALLIELSFFSGPFILATIIFSYKFFGYTGNRN